MNEGLVQRREFLKGLGLWSGRSVASALGVSLLATGLVGGGVLTYRNRQFQGELQLRQLRQDLAQWQGRALYSTGRWNASQVLQHLTQGIIGSLNGYPNYQNGALQHTLGPLALQGFKGLGQMLHPLDAPIPHMPALDPHLTTAQALTALLLALDQFLAHDTALAPHFAYGELSRDDYAAAHFLHISQHMQQIQLL
jgi:hypothetical protein